MAVNPNHSSIGGVGVPLDCPGGYYVNGTQVINTSGAYVGDIAATAGSIGTAELADASISPAKIVETEAVTATADGTGTGVVDSFTTLKKFVAVTSAAATDQVSLPGVTAARIGQEVYLTVAANGFELITPAGSGTTINQVDADGTNQLDVPANTVVHCTQTSTTGWIAAIYAATTVSVPAPDSD